MSGYPEHDKLHAVVKESQAQGEFLEWLSQQGFLICTYEAGHYTDDEFRDWIQGYHTVSESREQLLARYHGIDLKKIEAEKRAMLDAQRALSAVKP